MFRVLTCLGAVFSLVACTAPPQEVKPDGLDHLASQTLRWGACEAESLQKAKAECATVRVPMNYADPAGKEISVAISRVKASDPARRRGVLLTNPGGPGGEGLHLATRLVDQPAGAVYDTIGMDPRGVGESTPLECQVVADAPDLPTRPAEKDLDPFTAAARKEEAACAALGGDLRRHITTMNTARDMDLIRRVLREEKINYLGYSYGTFLGAMYGQLFPDHLDRSVLDSAMDPGTSWRHQELDALTTTKKNMEAWRDWVAQRDNTFHLGATPEAVQTTVDRFADVLRRRELGALDSVTTFDFAAGAATRYRAMWADFAWRLSDLLPALDGGPVHTASANELATFAEQEEDEEESDPSPGADKPTTTNGTMNAVLCDWAWPKNPADYQKDILRAATEAPYGGTAHRVAPHPCTFTGERDPLQKIEERKYPAGLVIQGEGDTQTTYANGTAMADHLNQPLISVMGSGLHFHYATTHDPCVDNPVNDYLINGKLPDRRTTCQAALDKVLDIPAGGTVSREELERPLADIYARITG